MAFEDNVGLALVLIAEALRSVQRANDTATADDSRKALDVAADALKRAQQELVGLLEHPSDSV